MENNKHKSERRTKQKALNNYFLLTLKTVYFLIFVYSENKINLTQDNKITNYIMPTDNRFILKLYTTSLHGFPQSQCSFVCKVWLANNASTQLSNSKFNIIYLTPVEKLTVNVLENKLQYLFNSGILRGIGYIESPQPQILITSFWWHVFKQPLKIK